MKVEIRFPDNTVSLKLNGTMNEIVNKAKDLAKIDDKKNLIRWAYVGGKEELVVIHVEPKV